jgi:putative PIN family toxin of toxin-antitoxin system
MSEEIYTEMKKVVTIKFPEFIPSYSAFEVMLRENTVLVPLGSITIDACRDNKDNMILETAVIGNCDAIITGDNDLLSLGHYKEISIFTPLDVVTSGLHD